MRANFHSFGENLTSSILCSFWRLQLKPCILLILWLCVLIFVFEAQRTKRMKIWLVETNPLYGSTPNMKLLPVGRNIKGNMSPTTSSQTWTVIPAKINQQEILKLPKVRPFESKICTVCIAAFTSNREFWCCVLYIVLCVVFCITLAWVGGHKLFRSLMITRCDLLSPRF